MAKYAQTEMITTRSSWKVAMHVHAKLVLYYAYNTLEQLDFNYGSARCAEPIRNTRRSPLYTPELLETKRCLTPKNPTYARSSCVTLIRPANPLPRRKREHETTSAGVCSGQHVTRYTWKRRFNHAKKE